MKERNSSKQQEEEEQEATSSHLSGAYIRTLVKQLTTNSKRDHPTFTKFGMKQHHRTQQQPPPPPSNPHQHHKKQVRRRLHTTKPYQERLLNMAEARREIVTALKFHRASMKNSDQHPQSQNPPPQPVDSPFEQAKLKSRRNPRIYAATSSDSNISTCHQNDAVCAPPANYYLPPSYWTIPPIAPLPPLAHDNLNLNLPNQTLGLNLNIQDFNNLVTPYVKISADEERACVPESGGDLKGLHQAMDDKGMAEIRSLGEQHEMEWKDKMNLVTSAWWFKFVKTMEMKVEDDKEGFHHPLVDQVMEIPAWLNANNLDDYCSNHYSQDPALPRMEIGEIEGVYEEDEWLAS